MQGYSLGNSSPVIVLDIWVVCAQTPLTVIAAAVSVRLNKPPQLGLDVFSATVDVEVLHDPT